MGLDDELDRRTFLKLGGLAVATTLVPAWLAGCTSAPPKKDTKKYVTARELFDDIRFDETGCAISMRSYAIGDIIHLKDTIDDINFLPNKNKTGISFNSHGTDVYLIHGDFSNIKPNTLIILTLPIINQTYVCSGKQITGDMPDFEDKKNSNTLKKA